MQAVDDLLEADVRRFPTLPLLPESGALRANLTPSDACYVAPARNLGCPLVTGDRRLSRAPGLGVPLITV
jgi:predicted nucleic acid-binding protein